MAYTGNKIAYFRKKNGLTQDDIREEVYKHTGKKFRQGTISSWENGKTAPDMDILSVLASILRVNVDDLYDKPEPKSEDIMTADLIRFKDGLAQAQELFAQMKKEEAYHHMEELCTAMLKKMNAISGSYEKAQAQLRAVREITRL
ncbi:helix-turn-helix transcriptional regulator [Fulvivirga sp. 29W222]|uniref:Helix-turn-helix transcriptional regulator n=1 Tax=Fulvivirga marina TaxID=2494733 RepID=A0A937KAY0_9BACT|nr:helix-turn-helix transcriptional regulator [Fulvivirga marina]MBL6446146.1 helix-turn-helix transcriptional regulator [Fulvivirga marina]